MLDFPLHRFRHRGDILPLVQKVSNDPVKVLPLGAENLHLREHLDKGLKTFEFHAPKSRKKRTILLLLRGAAFRFQMLIRIIWFLAFFKIFKFLIRIDNSVHSKREVIPQRPIFIFAFIRYRF
jgi:hypothetical protein